MLMMAAGTQSSLFSIALTVLLVAAGCSSATPSGRANNAVAPSISTQPFNQNVTVGQNATFVAAAVGSEPIAYQWKRNGTDISGATSASYTTPPTTLADNGASFQLVASNSTGSATSDSATLTVASGQSELITLSGNRRYLINSSTGQPVFLVGDDAFDLAVMLSSSQVEAYLSARANLGFNAIWVASVDNSNQPSPPKNYYGYSPFDGADFTNFDPNYWANLDSVVSTASSFGITVFLQPFFASNSVEQPDQYYASLLAASPATLQAYGAFLGNRYKNANNIVWLLGGDAKPTDAGVYSQLNILGAAIAAADPNHLMTFEACEQCVTNGYNSVSGFQAAGIAVPSWLSLNWAYPQYTTTVAAVQNAYTQTPFLPPLAGENFYELEHSMTEPELRFEMYTEILSGAYLGRIFGNGAIWSFDAPNGSTCCTDGSPTWESQLSSAGSVAQSYQGGLFRSREHWLLVPDINHNVVTAGYGSGLTITTAARTSDGQTIIAYIPNGNATTITVDMANITSSTSTVQGWWFNPQTAAATSIGTFPNSGNQNFTAPDSNDWVLVLDDASANLPAPGSSTASVH